MDLVVWGWGNKGFALWKAFLGGLRGIGWEVEGQGNGAFG